MNPFLISFSAGAGMLLGFLLFFHPLQQHVKANRWLGLFAAIMGCAFVCSYLLQTDPGISSHFLFKNLNGLQFLLGPSLYLAVLCFVQPNRPFKRYDGWHFLPFIGYAGLENSGWLGRESISVKPLFAVSSDVTFLVRDLLPVLTLGYLLASYRALIRHRANLKWISSNIGQSSLDWLLQLVYLLAIALVIWLNDALFGWAYLSAATSWLYAGITFFLAYFSIRQKVVFNFRDKDITAISELIAELPGHAPQAHKNKPNRLNEQQITSLSERLYALMEQERIFLDNDLNLPMVAEKLGVGIHETSFLINAVAKDNFYNFINRFRVEEAKRLLAGHKTDEWNMLGIAFASGFNSKTTFNTTFKKLVGVSPSQYAKAQKKGGK